MPVAARCADPGTVRIGIGVGSEVVGTPMAPQQVVAQAQDAEVAGFPAAWTVHFSRGIDALTVLGAAGQRTSRIDLGVGVVPTYPRHPHALAQQAATIQALCAGRLTLGVGVSHRPVIEGLFGLPYAGPAAHMRDYLSVLVPLLRDGSVTHRGETYAVDGGFVVPGTSPVSVLVGALAPRMVAVAGELADGVVTWLAGPRSLEGRIGPRLRAAAHAAGRPAPRVVAAVAVAVCTDPDAARSAAATVFARYQGLANYQRQLAREDVTSVADLAVVGDGDAVARQLASYVQAGATEIWAVPFPVDSDGDAVARTRRVLADIVSTRAPVGTA